MRNVLIVGGGALANAIRRWDQIHHLSPSDAHWLAIDAMSVTSSLAAKLLADVQWTDEWQAVLNLGADHAHGPNSLVFDPSRFLKEVEPTLPGERLSASWDVTSDSIAARIAQPLPAGEFVLLKSCLPAKEVATLEQASESGYVDRAFSRFAAQLRRLRFVNLRDAKFAEMTNA
jgi:aspartokinase-like uncharacterized kinase